MDYCAAECFKHKLINKDLRLQAPTSSAYGAKWWVIDIFPPYINGVFHQFAYNAFAT